MASIDAEQIAAAYDVGRLWLGGSISRKHAIEALAVQSGLNRVSAGDLIQVLSAMLSGERFTRSISAPAADHFISLIAEQDGPIAAGSAIKALDKHIEYYESIRPVTLHKLRLVRDSLVTKIVSMPLKEALSGFERDVVIAMAATPPDRKKLLPPKGHKPKPVLTMVTVYQRSAAVVAEVLLRAAGCCETCKMPAPFIKASSGKPYLEVHHKVQLAFGGDDTVDNAIAVCPNCHRFHHFG